MAQWMSCTIQQVTDTDTYRDVMARAWYNSDAGVDDSVNDFNTSGDFPGNVSDVDKDISIPFNGGTQKLHEKTMRVYKTYGASQDVYFAAWLRGINYYDGVQVYDNAEYVVPARAYDEPSAPGTPTISLLTGTSARASWGDPADWGGDNSSDFEVQIATSSSMSGASTYGVANANHRDFSGLAPGTTYYTRVRATNAGGTGPWSGTRSFTTHDVPSTPGQPTASSITGTSVTLGWAAPTSDGGDAIDGYDLEVDDNTGFTSPLEVSGNLDRSHSVTGLTPGVTYYARVSAYNGVGNSVFSTVRAFTMLDYASAPQDLTVSDISGVGGTVTWNPPADSGGAGIGSYEIEVDTDPAFASPAVYSQASRTKTLGNLAPSTTYHVRVRAITSVGAGAWATTSFDTVASMFVNVGGKKTVIAAYVNVGGTGKLITDVLVKA